MNVLESQTVTVNLTAQGVGTTIVTEPKFGPMWNVGPHLSNREYDFVVF